MARKKLYMKDIEERYGASKGTVLAWRRRKNLPPEDGMDLDKGHARPWWWESTLKGWTPPRTR